MSRRMWIWLAGCGAGSAALLLCMAFVDRPLALLCWSAFGSTQLRAIMDANSGRFFVLLAVVLLLLCRMRNLAMAAVAGLLAMGVNLALKQLFGRSNPDLVFMLQHQYGFHPLHASQYWSSFPSGTVAVATAAATVIYTTQPRLRIAMVVFMVLSSGLIVLATAHWLSDVLAAAALGVFIGRQTAARLESRS